MLRQFLVAIFVLAFSGMVYADAPKEEGGYIGVGFGDSEFDDDDGFGGVVFDDDDVSWQFAGGVRFNRNIAVEARFNNLGKAKVGPDDIEAETTTVHVVGILPLGDNGWELMGQFGIGFVNVDLVEDEEDESVDSFGIGLRYHFSEENALALQWDTYQWDEDGASPEVDTIQLVWTHTF